MTRHSRLVVADLLIVWQRPMRQHARQHRVPPRNPNWLRNARQLVRLRRLQKRADHAEYAAGASPSPQERQSIELYRTFCLVALGNTDEANKAIEAMVSRDPLYRPNMDDVPPRCARCSVMHARRLLPALIQERYIIAKAAFDRGGHEDGRRRLHAGADGAIRSRYGWPAKQPPLADLRVLASGFNDLTVRALTPPPVPVAH